MDLRVLDGLEGIEKALSALVASMPAPGFEYPLKTLAEFSWETIGAKVIHEDEQGAAIVRYFGHNYSRYEANSEVVFLRGRGNKQEVLILFR
ncbi:MAG: single-stranded DNA-binding protein [Cyanobacteria bacterium J06559_3]